MKNLRKWFGSQLPIDAIGSLYSSPVKVDEEGRPAGISHLMRHMSVLHCTDAAVDFRRSAHGACADGGGARRSSRMKSCVQRCRGTS